MSDDYNHGLADRLSRLEAAVVALGEALANLEGYEVASNVLLTRGSIKAIEAAIKDLRPRPPRMEPDE